MTFDPLLLVLIPVAISSNTTIGSPASTITSLSYFTTFVEIKHYSVHFCLNPG